VWLVLPTYDEADNLERFVGEVLPRLAAAAPEGHRLLVVDDASPDGTGLIADRLAAEHDAVEVLHRSTKAAQGQAYLAGFGVALAAGATRVCTNFSHSPEDLPRLVAGTRDADVVLGSRYVLGGRRGQLGRPAPPAQPRGDDVRARRPRRGGARPHGGFKSLRREVLEAVGLEHMHADGYGFHIELTYRALRAGFRVRGTPIVFCERRAGRSKMTLGVALEALWTVPALRAGLLPGGGRAYVPGGREVWIVGSPCTTHTSGLSTGMKERSPPGSRPAGTLSRPGRWMM